VSGSPAASATDRWAIPALLLTACLAFGGTVGYGFVWDDHEQVVDNAALRSWDHLGDFWTTDVLGTTRETGERSNYYRPLFFVEYLLLYQAFGLDARAWHAGAILLHLLAAVVGWRLLRRLGVEPALALLAALLFLAHPVHTESVSWIAAAYNDAPTAILLLLALAAHLLWLRRSSPWALAGAGLAFALALCIKETGLSLLLLLPVAEAYERCDERWRRTLLPYGGLLSLLALGLVAEAAGWLPASWGAWAILGFQVALCALGAGLIGRRTRISSVGAWSVYVGLALAYFHARRMFIVTTLGALGAHVSWPRLAATQPLLLGYYLRFIVWPWGLSPSYPLRYVSGDTAVAATLWAAALVVAGVAVWRFARARRLVALGLLWLVACLLPALDVQPFREAYLVHHRYLYLAILGPCLIIAWALLRAPWPRAVKAAASILAVAALTTASAAQNHFWRSDRDLWLRVAEVDPANVAAPDWLGRDALDAGRIDEAERWLRRSVEVAPSSGRGAYNLALLLHRERHDPRSALPWYEAALRVLRRDDPEEREIYLRSALNYAAALAQTGSVDRALDMLLELAGPPHYLTDAARNAAVLLVQRGEPDRALEIIAAALAQHPGDSVLTTMRRDLETAGSDRAQ
jgi:protein O-mannosyl-transferase